MKAEDRIKGSLYGIAVGDALGAPCEFRRPSDIKNVYGRVKEMIGTSEFAPGEPTDDTFLAMATARAYNQVGDKNVFSPEYAAEAMVAWMNNLGKGIGRMTSVALGNITSGRTDVYNSGHKALASIGANKGAGNGSLMRCASTGWVRSFSEIDKIVKESAVLSEITHADPRCVAACVGYNIVLAGLIEDQNYYTLLGRAIEGTRDIDETTAKVFEDAKVGYGFSYDPNVMSGMGYVLRALDRALTAVEFGYLKENENVFEETIVQVANEGGDADTNAAITGGLLGAMYGYEAIPKRWTDALLYKDELETTYEMIMRFRGGR